MKILSASLVVAGLLIGSQSFAATRYVGKTNASDSGACTNQATPCATIAYGISQMAGGDTLIVGNGTYTGSSNIVRDPPNGSSGAYTTIRAETDFGVLLDGSSWGTNNWVYGIRIENRSYVTVQGFRINAAQNATGGPIYMGNGANHIKIIRNGFFGGVVTDNGETAGTGPDTSYILFEENYSFGGGRAGFTAYWSDHVVFRRNVVRIDYYRFDLQSSGFCNYDSSNTVFQNNIVVDMAGGSNVSPSLQVYAPFFFENKSDHEPNTSIEMHGNIVLNNSTYYGAVWDQVPASTRVLRDNIFWGNSGGFQAGEYENGETFIAPIYDIQRLTSGNNNKSYDHWNNAFDHAAVYTTPADGLNGAGTGISIAEHRAVSFQNSLLYGNPSYGAADYAQGNYNAYYGNGAARGGSRTPSAGANDITSHDAIYSGSNTSGSIKWLPKGPESGSVLATAGSSSGKIGAEVMWKIGVNGTLYGESGWNTVRSPANGYGGTSDRLWPFPNETQIKSDMSAYSGGGLPGARGFATGTSMDGTVQSLTKYIWEAAGNQAPADYYSETGGNTDTTAPTATTSTSDPSSISNDSLNVTGSASDAVDPTNPTPPTNCTHYVRPDGSNSNAGTSNTAGGAWLTLQYAANTVTAGAVVCVADGTFAGFYQEKSGTSGSPITYRALGSGANITSRNSRTTDNINIESWTATPSSYITIDGFNVYNATRMGIRAIAGTGIVIKNNTAHNNADCGIFSGDTPGIQVLNNNTYENGTTQYQHNIYISNAASDSPVIRGNTIRDSNAGNGLHVNGDWLEGGDGYIDNAIIESNLVYGNAAKGLSLTSMRHGTIRNNIIYNNGGAGGIHIVEQQGSHYSIDNVVVNNTIDEQSVATVRINTGNTGNVVLNNISIGSTGIVFEGTGNYQSNNYSASSGGSSIFTNYAGHNYTLLSTSPAKEYGTSSYQSKSAPTTDYLGNARPSGSGYDAGAYEYQTGEPSGATAPVGLKISVKTD